MELIQFRAEILVPGGATGYVLSTDEPLSLWGGLDAVTGEIIDRRHPLSGQNVSGRVLSLPFGRGSCSASGVLLEAAAIGVGPAAILVSSRDPVLGLGAVLVDELLGKQLPLVLVSEPDRRSISDNAWLVEIGQDGLVRARRQT